MTPTSSGKGKTLLVLAAFVVIIGAVALYLMHGDRASSIPEGDSMSSGGKADAAAAIAPSSAKRSQGGATTGVSAGVTASQGGAAASGEVATGDSQGEEEQISDEERAEREETALVDAFDALTDKWMEPAKCGVTMEDVDLFSEQFRKVPKARREECLQRALNLVPDENVMLLAGILMDKSQDKELIELVFNDVLNRDEDVKKPIMQQIFKDKEHPCWVDTAWILDVTGEMPGKSQR